MKIKENVPGRFYVNLKCIGCSICSEIAPDNFKSNLEAGYEYIYRQPSNEQEKQLCMEAMEICPVNAIMEKV